MEFERTNTNTNVDRYFTSQNGNYLYEFQGSYRNGDLTHALCTVHKLEETEDGVKHPVGRLGFISQQDSARTVEIPKGEDAAIHISVFEYFLSFLEDENS